MPSWLSVRSPLSLSTKFDVTWPPGASSTDLQELPIAFHVGRGMTNREVGAALFPSHKTIEFRLGRVYRKLDMHSRADLISRFAREATEQRAPAT
jgi:DNA-binding NarL/FixJ family response regulator